jgi:DNA repair protein SbcC/Rad50
MILHNCYWEAAKTLDRFERVAQQLYDQQKLLENEIAIKETRRCELLTRIKQLRETPRKSDLLFSDLCFLLSSFGWINQPKTKSQADELSTLLQTALINVHLIVSLGGALPKNADKLETLIQSLNETEKTIKELSKDDISYKKENTRIKIRVQELAKRLELLDLLAQVENAGIRTLYLKRQSLERQINDTKAVLTEVESASSRLFPDKVPNQTILSQAVQEWSDKVRRAGETMEDKRNALASYERTQNILRSFYQRLHSSAKDLMQHSGDRTHCPLCRAEYSEGELEKIFEEGSRGIVTGESDQLRTELQTAVALHQQYVSEFRALQTLERHFPGNSGSSSVEAIIQSVTSQGEHLATLVSELEIVRDILSEQEEKGRTFERLIELTTMLGISETEISSEHIDYLRKSTQDEQINLFNLNKKIESDGKEVSAKISEIGLVFNLSNPTVENLTIAVSKRRQSTMDTREAIIGLKSQIALEKLNSASELNAQLSEAHELNVRLRTEVAKEQQNSKVIIEETKLADDTTKEIEGLRVKLLRIDSACKVIRALLSQQSQRFLTEKVLRENAQKIAATFSKIHSPNEFNLVTNGGLKIIRRSGGNVELDEMSSGQRAAYALSLFLSINERLRTGPRVLLFDDPVAHVDDINTLSFLDHLRDIALSGQRQIFFATADSKIGALFNRKFSFLGEKFKRIELTRD